MTDHHLSDLGLSYDSQEKNLYKFNNCTKFAYNFVRFYTWTKKCDEFYKIEINKVWEEIFSLSDLIVYQTTQSASESSRTVNDSSEINTPKTFGQLEYDDIGDMVQTGYVIPKYEFLFFKLNGGFYGHLQQEPVFYKFKKLYKEAVELFDLNKNGKISINQYIQIAKLRNILFEQLTRQANLVHNIISELADILKVYYFESERAVVKAKNSASSKTKIDEIDKDWTNIREGLSELFNFKIRGGLTLETIKWHIENDKLTQKERSTRLGVSYTDFEPFQLDNDKYVSKDILEYILGGYKVYMKQKESIIDTSMVLFEQIAPLESMLEDFFLKRKIKTADEFKLSLSRNLVNKYQGDRYWDTYKKYYQEMKNMENAYDRIVKEMDELGLNIRHTSFESFKTSYYQHLKKVKG